MGKLDNPGFCTLVVAVDNHYLDKLLHTYPTWLACHPELLNMDHCLVFDADQLSDTDARFAKLYEICTEWANRHKSTYFPRFKFVSTRDLWVDRSESQREKMLTALVRATVYVETPWYLKLDADTFANKKTGFYYDKWFRGDPCFIANPWGYSKPADTLDKLNQWFLNEASVRDTSLRGLPLVTGLKVEREPGDNWKVKHRRMASWVMFGNTKWTQYANSLCPTGRLPAPSQDTYLSFIQALRHENWVPVKFRAYGWEHCKNFRGLKTACKNTLNSVLEMK